LRIGLFIQRILREAMSNKMKLLREFKFFGAYAVVVAPIAVLAVVAMYGLGRDEVGARAALADAGIMNDVQIDTAYHPFENCKGLYRTRVSYRGQDGKLVHARVCSGGLGGKPIIQVLTP
jgi:hypothetical protein